MLLNLKTSTLFFTASLAATALVGAGCDCDGRISYLGSPDSGSHTADGSVGGHDAGPTDGGPNRDAGHDELFWAKRLGGNIIDEPTALAVGPSGIFVVGFYNAYTVFGDGEPGQVTLRSTGATGPDDYISGIDAFIVKFSEKGRPLWARSEGSNQTDLFTGVAATDEGGAVVAGRFDEMAVLGRDEANETTLTGNVLARYNADGSLAWASNPPDNALLVAKTTGGAFVTLGNDSTQALVLAKYDGSGQQLWKQRVAGAKGTALSAFADGSIAIAGNLTATATFGSTTLSPNGGEDVFAAKYGSDGTARWATAGTSASYDSATGIAALASGGVVVVGTSNAAFTWGATSVPAGGGNTSQNFVFVTTLASDGTAVWTKASQATGAWGSAEARRVTAFADDSVVVTGNFDKEVTFGAGDAKTVKLPGSEMLNGRYNVFLARYWSTGQLAWARRASEAENAKDVAVTERASGSIFWTGSFCDRAVFEFNDVPVTSSLQARRGGCDIYLAKYPR